MRTTIIFEDNLVAEASRLTGVKEKTFLVKMGLKTLIAYESGRRSAKLGGSEPQRVGVY
jgi:Arc/MetJ family transcription regulator